jgi:hypothetical protein
MNKLLLALGALTVSALVVPGDADARRGGGGGFGGGGARVGGGGFGGGGARAGGFGGSRMYVPRGGQGIARAGGYGGGSIGVRPGTPGRVGGVGTGDFRRAAIASPGGRFDNRVGNRGDWRYGYGATGGRYPYYGGRYPNYGRYYGGYYGRYPYSGWGWGAAGLATGAAIGAAATYPYYSYPYSSYQTPVATTADGGYCVTPARTCSLTNSAPIGTGCSCRISGGRARGTVQ